MEHLGALLRLLADLEYVHGDGLGSGRLLNMILMLLEQTARIDSSGITIVELVIPGLRR